VPPRCSAASFGSEDDDEGSGPVLPSPPMRPSSQTHAPGTASIARRFASWPPPRPRQLKCNNTGATPWRARVLCQVGGSRCANPVAKGKRGKGHTRNTPSSVATLWSLLADCEEEAEEEDDGGHEKAPEMGCASDSLPWHCTAILGELDELRIFLLPL